MWECVCLSVCVLNLLVHIELTAATNIVIKVIIVRTMIDIGIEFTLKLLCFFMIISAIVH